MSNPFKAPAKEFQPARIETISPNRVLLAVNTFVMFVVGVATVLGLMSYIDELRGLDKLDRFVLVMAAVVMQPLLWIYIFDIFGRITDTNEILSKYAEPNRSQHHTSSGYCTERCDCDCKSKATESNRLMEKDGCLSSRS